MKKLLLCSLFLILFFKGNTQVNADCINAIPLCSNPSFTFYQTSGAGNVVDFNNSTSSVSNPTNNPFPPNNGCLKSGELNPQWLLLTIGNAGVLEFVFGAANSQHPQAGCYDWVMWPYNPNTCADIFNNTLAPIACNWNGTCSNGTGMASAAHYTVFGGNSLDFQPPITVSACQQFIICISNYSGVNTLVSFQSLGTASLSCSPNCNPNYAICWGQSIMVVPANYAALTNPSYTLQPLGLTNNTGSFVVSPTVTTTYTTIIKGLNSLNAVQTVTSVSTVSVNPQPSAAPTITQTSCTSTINAVNLNVTYTPNAVPGYTVSWLPIPNGVTNTATTDFTGGIAPGAYNATITTTDGCTTTTNFVINPIPDPAIITLNPLGTNHVLTCTNPSIAITAMNPSYSYTWNNGLGSSFTTSTAVFNYTAQGTWTVFAFNPTSSCTATQIFSIGQNTVAPSSTVNPLFQNITCSLSSISTITAIANPTVNVTHQIMAPQGGTFTATSYTTVYTPGGIGTFTHCAINDVNGCSTCTTFTLTSNQGFPTYSVVSPQSFTLGCGTKSVATINIINAATTPTAGGPVSYTLISPGNTTGIQSGTLSTQSSYTVDVPGTWTVVTEDNTNFCQTRVPISVLSNTFEPDISAIVPTQVLNCDVPKIILKGQSLTNNVGYLWMFPGTPGTQPGDTIMVSINKLAPSNSVVATFTLSVTNNNSTCKSFSVIPIYQNIFLPHVAITNGGTGSLTCNTSTITLTNESSTGIPTIPMFPNQNYVIAYLWEGPTPQEPEQLKTTYLAATVGTYTLTAKDLNNGCIGTGTIAIGDNRNYPTLNKPASPPAFILDCGSTGVSIAPIYNTTNTASSYNWTAPPGATLSANNTPSITVNQTGNYRVVVTNTLNGCGSLGEVSVINGSLTADFEPIPAKGYAPLEVTFFNNSISSNTLSGAKNIQATWSFGNGYSKTTDPSNLAPTTVYTQPGTFKVKMFVAKGTCLDTMEKTIEVEIPSKMDIPNVFTPNGDNINDIFFLKGSNLETISILICDRWGHKVYELVSETGNFAWDGKTQTGKDASEGTYFYTIKATGKDGYTFNTKGTVSLYR
jgi:gliding motility-associated-like protein